MEPVHLVSEDSEAPGGVPVIASAPGPAGVAPAIGSVLDSSGAAASDIGPDGRFMRHSSEQTSSRKTEMEHLTHLNGRLANYGRSSRGLLARPRCLREILSPFLTPQWPSNVEFERRGMLCDLK
jgi:hypothetical protein